MLGSFLDWNSSITSTCSQPPGAAAARRRHPASPRRCRKSSATCSSVDSLKCMIFNGLFPELHSWLCLWICRYRHPCQALVPQASAPVREYADGRPKPRSWRQATSARAAVNHAADKKSIVPMNGTDSLDRARPIHPPSAHRGARSLEGRASGVPSSPPDSSATSQVRHRILRPANHRHCFPSTRQALQCAGPHLVRGGDATCDGSWRGEGSRGRRCATVGRAPEPRENRRR